MMNRSLPRVAYHEAGHAVIAYDRWMTFTSVTIRPAPERNHNAEIVDVTFRAGNPNMVNQDFALMVAGGMAAEAIRRGRKSVGIEQMMRQHGGDMHELRELTADIGDLPAYDTRRRKRWGLTSRRSPVRLEKYANWKQFRIT